MAAGVPDAASGPIVVVPTLAALAASALEPGQVAYLSEPGREGLFRCVSRRPSQADPMRGLFVPAASGSRHFARVWDGITGRPEWFGAQVNDGRADCAPAIEACIVLCPITQLAQADYFIRRTLVIDRGRRTLRGTARYASDEGQGTRIILQASAPRVHDADVLLVGSMNKPAVGHDNYPTGIHVADLTLIRDGDSAPHASGDLRRYPAGLRASYLVHCTFARITSLESSVGFYFGGTVYTKVDDCLAQRTRPGSRTGPDLAAGFYLDGTPEIGLAGGNASIYLDRCLSVGQHASHIRPSGLVAEGAFVDSFIDRFESARVDTGMRFNTRGANGPTQTVDLHLRHCVLDGCGANGIELDLKGTQTASIEIIDPYIYASGAGGAAGIVVIDGGGLVTITGGQVHGVFRDGSLLLRQTRGTRVQGLKLHEGTRPVVIENSGALQIEPQISNMNRRTDAFAVTCAKVYRTTIRPLVIGAPGMLGGGVALDTGCNYMSVDTSAVDPGCFVAVDAARKLWFAGADAVRGAGAAAFARAGNVVVGVTG
ncbi:hypothetical protein [Sphingomonas sp. Mn802worker]|uniref:hypothetical protein n=1 Tax=Sphingomonas sp. Mn802worker TaxID=629773 RepID=UPI0012E9BBFA|nr:hypothetical protein [Sphingomonas sp. Mn802worker]